jgi:hypothetical protein
VKGHLSSCSGRSLTTIRLNSKAFSNPLPWAQDPRRVKRVNTDMLYGWPFGPWATVVHEFLHVLNPGDHHSDSFWQTLETILNDILPPAINGEVDQKAA